LRPSLNVWRGSDRLIASITDPDAIAAGLGRRRQRLGLTRTAPQVTVEQIGMSDLVAAYAGSGSKADHPALVLVALMF
jgi:hypothetical protein